MIFKPSLPTFWARRHLLAGTAAAAALGLLGCGGGGGAGISDSLAGVGSGGTGSFASGPIRGFGSVIINNVRYDDSTASIATEGGKTARAADLKLGMVAEVTGSDITTDTTGQRRATASAISVRSEVEGPLTAIDTAAGTLTVLGQRVQVTANTVFDDDLRGGLASLAVGQIVEVYGLLNSAGQYAATRIEREDSFTSQYKLRGVVSGLNTTARTFRIGTAVVFYGDVANQAVPLADGQYARVELFTTPTGGQWRASRLQVTSTGTNLPTIGNVNVELEGYITAYVSTTQFSVNGTSVQVPGGVRLPAGLALGQRVEVKGVLTNGQITAREVELEDDDGGVDDGGFEIEGAITQIDTAARTFTVRGVVVNFANARFEDGTAANLVVGVKVDVKGQLASNGTVVVAQEVEFDN